MLTGWKTASSRHGESQKTFYSCSLLLEILLPSFWNHGNTFRDSRTFLAELGTFSHQAHRDVLQQCVDSKIDAVGVCGEAFGQVALEFGPEHSKIEGMYSQFYSRFSHLGMPLTEVHVLN
jgi:hypothetical protein